MDEILLNKIAVVQMWPEIKAAEDEVIARIVNTCKVLDVEVLLINTAGRLVDSPDKQISSNDVDFVIHLHFESPKTYDAFSFVTLWNPLQFYFDWGYRKYSNNIISHDDFLSCDSPCADDHVKRMILAEKTHLEPYFNLFHSLSGPICKPGLGRRKLFYVGINWEALGRGKGRHQDLLQSLDKTGDLVIYGPEKFQGVNVWEDYKSYVGSLPFDGESVIRAIDDAGITLVLSSKAHLESELMSNRLFEGLAAGSVIIVDENKFAKKHFGDTLLYIKTEGLEPEEITSQVREHLDWVSLHQDKAIEMAEKAQQIFKEKFDMVLSIKNIYKKLPERKKMLADVFLHQIAQYSLTVIGLLKKFDKDDLLSIVGNFTKQTYQKKKLILIVDEYEYNKHKIEIDKAVQSHDGIKLHVVVIFKRDSKERIVSWCRFGAVFFDVLNSLPDDELVSVLPYNERLFSEHYSSLVRAFEDDPALDISHTNVLRTYRDASGKQLFDLLDVVRPFCQQYNNPNGYSRYLFKNKKEDWKKFTVKYLSWGVVDAIYCKSKERKCITRASCIIDIQNMLYHPDEINLFEKDMQLLLDSMNADERKSLSIETFSGYGLSGMPDSRVDFDDYTIDEKRKILVGLFDSIGFPVWVRRIVRKLYRLLSKA